MEDKEIKQLEKINSVVDVAKELGVKFSKSMGECFRAEKHPDGGEDYTLFFNLAKNTFLCKTCPDVGGSVTDLVCQIKGCDRDEAIEWLAHRVEFDQKTKKMYHGRGRKK
jgi:hypothetical protein